MKSKFSWNVLWNIFAVAVSIAVVVAVTALTIGPASAMAAPEIALNYPELQEVPTASQRVQMEMKNSSQGQWKLYLPIDAAGLSVLTAGIVLSSEDHLSYDSDRQAAANNAAVAAEVVGTGWLGAALYLSFAYNPYENAYAEISQMPKTQLADALLRERIAEEGLEKAGLVAKRLAWVSAVSNFTCAALVMSYGSNSARFAGGVAMAGALLPLVFPLPWQDIYKKHLEYRKRIYGPVTPQVTSQTTPHASIGLIRLVGQDWIPSLQVRLVF